MSNNSSSVPRIRIPDLLEKWPWPAMVNPAFTDELHNEEIAHMLVVPDVQESPMLQLMVKKALVPLLAAYTYPSVTEAQLRGITRFIHWSLIVDDPLEQGDIDVARTRIEGSIQSFRDPDGGHAHADRLGESVSRSMQGLFSSSEMYQKFLDTVTRSFLPTILKQAEGHKNSTLPTIEDWMRIRVQNFAFDCFRTFFEFDDPLPEDLISGQILQSFAAKAGLMACLANDLYSYNKEQAEGDTFNTISVVIYNLGIDLDSAVDWLEAEHTRLLNGFLDELRDLPSFGTPELDVRVRRWVNDVAAMVRGNTEWHFASPRYFGKDGALVCQRGYVDLLPKRSKGGLPTPSSTS